MSHNNINLSQQTAVYRKNKRNRRIWKRIVSVLGCIVVFITTYALILPAKTLDDAPVCGFEEHRHDSSCYLMQDPVSQLRCTASPHVHSEECDNPCLYADFFLHSHDTDYSQMGAFVCSLQERKAHAHSEGCFTENIPLICSTEESEGHTHGEDCFTETTELTCTLPESEAHLHEETCFDENGELVCEIPETEGHTHGEECYTTVSTLICELPETEGHTHGDGCYGEPELVLTCDKPVYILHTHEDSCYSVPSAEGEEPVLICGTVELLEHIHDESCLAYTEADPVPILICEKTEHEHSDSCFPPEDTTAATGETDPTDTTLGTDPTDSTLSTDPTETTEVTEPAVLAVIEKIAVIYTDETYTELSTDTTVITVTGLIPVDAEIRAYPVTIESEKEVLLAFDLTIFLPDGTVFEPAEGEQLTVTFQAPDLNGEVYYIPEDGAPELIDTTVTEDGVQFDTGHFSVYAVMAAETGLSSETIPTGSAGSYWHSSIYPNYQLSTHLLLEGNLLFGTGRYVETFILVSTDEFGGKTWTPDSVNWTMAGNHNYYVTYCADYEHGASDDGNVLYIYKTVIENTSFSASQQKALRNIIYNSYPFITEAQMRERLTAAGYSGDFTAAEMLAGTQKAVWKTTDNQDLGYYDQKIPSEDIGVCLNPLTEVGPGGENEINDIYDYLLNKATSPVVYDNLAVSDTLWTQNSDGSYTVTISLNRAVLEDEAITATLSNGDVSVTKELSPGTDHFTMIWSAGFPETGNITLRLKGSRKAFNVYYYDDGGDYQNMVGGQYDLVELDYEEVLIRSTTNITVVKNWVEADPSIRPSELIVYLTINGSHVVEDGVSPIVLSESNNWTYTWTNLPTFKNGIALNYSVDEVTPAGYSGRFVTNKTNGDKTITITNTQIPVELQTSLSVSKQWEDGNSTHSGQAIIVHLYADGVYTGKDLVMSDATSWFVTFDGLPYYREDGVTPIEYTIVEEKVEGYVPDYGDTTPIPNETTWEQATALQAGSVYRFVSNGVALSCDANGNLTATADGTEDKYQWWSVAKSGSSWTLTNVATGKMVGFSNNTYVSADSGVALTFSNNRLSYKSGSFIFYTTYYLSLSEGSAATTSSSSNASTFTVYKKTSIDKVPAYNITLTNRLAPTYELPQTGGVGTELFTFGGIAAIAAALMWGCSLKRKRERGAV